MCDGCECVYVCMCVCVCVCVCDGDGVCVTMVYSKVPPVRSDLNRWCILDHELNPLQAELSLEVGETALKRTEATLLCRRKTEFENTGNLVAIHKAKARVRKSAKATKPTVLRAR